jgi:hypothetical protein
MNTCSRYLELVATDAAHAYAFFQCTLPKKTVQQRNTVLVGELEDFDGLHAWLWVMV